MRKMKRITLAIGLTLAVAVGAGVNAKPALALSYLASPTLSTSSGAFTFTTSATGSTTYYATGNSSYGNTIPTVTQLANLTGLSASSFYGKTVQDSSAAPVFYDPSTLGLTQIASEINPYQMGTIGGTVITGNVISNVFRIGTNATMTGAVPGELVFTYQFDVTGVASNNNTGIASANVGNFNLPDNLYALGSGINVNSSGSIASIGTAFGSGSLTTYDPTSVSNGQIVSGSPTAFTGMQDPGGITGQITYANDGTVANLQYNATDGVTVGEYSPQFFVASNAFYFGGGQISVIGSGGLSGGADVYVPNTPEPGTIVLFGTALGFLAFMFARNRKNFILS